MSELGVLIFLGLLGLRWSLGDIAEAIEHLAKAIRENGKAK